jgi:hypothetical protein
MKVFLSYRRADTQPVALLIARFLARVPGVEAENFRRRIVDELPKASHVIVLIGPQWRGPAGPSGTARIVDEADVVRQEVAAALDGAAKVVPILVDGTSMPKLAELPPSLHRLGAINAFPLRLAHFDDDMDTLMRRLTGSTARALAAPLSTAAIAKRAAIGTAVSCVLVLGLAMVHSLTSTDLACADLACGVQRALGLPSREDALTPMMLLVAAVVGACALAPFVPRWVRQLRGD